MSSHDGCASLLGVIALLAFSSHVFGILGPFWLCEGHSCSLRGIYYTCGDGSCSGDVPDTSVLVLALIVLISSFLLLVVICCLLECCYFKYYNLKYSYGVAVCVWFLLQELLTTVILILLHARYTRVGWSAYGFTIPGLILFFIVAFILFFKYCWPFGKHRVGMQ